MGRLEQSGREIHADGWLRKGNSREGAKTRRRLGVRFFFRSLAGDPVFLAAFAPVFLLRKDRGNKAAKPQSLKGGSGAASVAPSGARSDLGTQPTAHAVGYHLSVLRTCRGGEGADGHVGLGAWSAEGCVDCPTALRSLPGS